MPLFVGQVGDARSAADREALTRSEHQMALPLLLSAVIPLFLLPGGAFPVLVAAVFIASWVVFVVDLIVHSRRLYHYLRTWLGRFDLLVVILTAPWFLVLGPSEAKFVLLIRLARVARLVIATKGARRLLERLGSVTAVAMGVVTIGAAVAYHAEHATNAGFKTYGDSLWWAIVTLTTVGYGDIVPKTTGGRIDGMMIMVAGVGILGVLAGSMASFFRRGTDAATPGITSETDDRERPGALVEELAKLRVQVAQLSVHVAGLAPPTEETAGQPPS